jgi:hypothetical protein
MEENSAEKREYGRQRKMSQVLGAFGLLDVTMLRPVLAWRAIWDLRTIYLFNFQFFSGRGKARILNKWIRGHGCVLNVRFQLRFFFWTVHCGIHVGQEPTQCALFYTYLLIPWSRILLENLTGMQLVKKFPAFYGTRRFITAFIIFRYPYPQPDQSGPYSQIPLPEDLP